VFAADCQVEVFVGRGHGEPFVERLSGLEILERDGEAAYLSARPAGVLDGQVDLVEVVVE